MSRERLGNAIRTLTAAGYAITASREHPRYVEIDCERTGQLGVRAFLLVAVTDEAEFSETEVIDLLALANADGRQAVFVAGETTATGLSWDEFFETLGGEIPNWRALTAEYANQLHTASQNEVPSGMSGEAWRIHEELVADGLEFIFGRRALRMGGGKTRGRAVSDIVVPLPTLELLVVDAKATADGFDAAFAKLRALGEYVTRQFRRQVGQRQVQAACVVSSQFKQNDALLGDVSTVFAAEYGVPCAFIVAGDLVSAVEIMKPNTNLRNALRFKQLFRGGRFRVSELERELEEARSERYPAE